MALNNVCFVSHILINHLKAEPWAQTYLVVGGELADWHQLVAGREGRQRAREDRAQRRLWVARRSVGVGEMVRPRTRGEDSTKLLLGMGRILLNNVRFSAFVKVLGMQNCCNLLWLLART